jgi:hypothetical protein
MNFKPGDKIVVIGGPYLFSLRHKQERAGGFLEVKSIYHGLDGYFAYEFVGDKGYRWELKEFDAELYRTSEIEKPKEFKLPKGPSDSLYKKKLKW